MRTLGAALWLAACGEGQTAAIRETGTSPPTTAEVEAALDAANRCEDASECVNAASMCPFGCWILVNEEEVEEVVDLLDAWRDAQSSTCTYSCANLGAITCVDGRCVGETTYRDGGRP